jgi:plastocyanin
MANDTVFYIVGSCLAATALIVSFLGLRDQRFPGRFYPVVILIFALLVAAAMTFAVRTGKDETAARAAENAQEAAATTGQTTAQAPSSGQQGGTSQGGASQQGGGASPQQAAPKGPGGNLKISADPSGQLAFDTKSLSSKPGKVTVTFTNPQQIAHNFAVEQNGKLLGQTPLITGSTAKQTFDLAAGSYTFLCTVPGHAQAGMQGTLTVK